jgi:hypothetical protein
MHREDNEEEVRVRVRMSIRVRVRSRRVRVMEGRKDKGAIRGKGGGLGYG